MDTSPATRKVAFCLISIILTLVGVVALSQTTAEALTGFYTRAVFGNPNIYVRTGPTQAASIKYQLPVGAAINIDCVAKDVSNNNWLKLIDGNYLAEVNSSYRISMNIAPICSTKLYSDRALLQGSGPAVYVIQSGKILWVPNEETLNTCLGGASKVIHISDSELNAAKTTYPSGGTATCPISFPNGTLVQASGPGVYLISNNMRLGIPNPSVLACYGGWGAVRKISDYDWSRLLTSYADGGSAGCPFYLPNGTKLLAPGGTVYIVSWGKTYGMPNEWTLNTCYGGWSGVRSASQAEIDMMIAAYPYAGSAGCAAPSYSVPNGTKLLAPSGTVYIVSWGKSYGMPNEWALRTCYGGWAGVRSAAQAEINQMMAAYPYAGSAGCNAPAPSTREQKAIDWMRSQLGVTGWNGWCEKMVEAAYGTTGRYASALAHANSKIARGEMHSGDKEVPAGAIAFFGAAKVNGGYGHVMISIGGGQFISNGYTWNGVTYGARVTTIDGAASGPYIGWAWADAGWSR